MELSGTGVGSGPEDEETVKLRWVLARRMMELSGGGGLMIKLSGWDLSF